MLTKTHVYNVLKVSMFKMAFFAWLRDIEEVAYNKGLTAGYKEGYSDGHHNGRNRTIPDNY